MHGLNVIQVKREFDQDFIHAKNETRVNVISDSVWIIDGEITIFIQIEFLHFAFGHHVDEFTKMGEAFFKSCTGGCGRVCTFEDECCGVAVDF